MTLLESINMPYFVSIDYFFQYFQVHGSSKLGLKDHTNLRKICLPALMHSHLLSCTLIYSHALLSTLMHSHLLSCTLIYSHLLPCTLIYSHALSSTLKRSHQMNIELVQNITMRFIESSTRLLCDSCQL